MADTYVNVGAEITSAQSAAVAALAAQRSLLASFVDADTSAEPEAEYVYRLTGAPGAVVKAQADTLTNASALKLVGADGGAVPLTEPFVVKFDSAPTVGLPAYLSATVLGKMSNTVPALDPIPIGVVEEDLSVGSNYRARVSPPYNSIVQGGSDVRGDFLSRTARDLGGLPRDYSVMGLDFDAMASANTPEFSITGIVVSGTVAALTEGSQINARTDSTISSITTKQWALEVRWKVTVGASPGSKALYFISNTVVGLGMFATGVPGMGKWVAYDSTYCNPAGSGIPTNQTTMGDSTGNLDICEMQGDGAGKVRWRLNRGTWSAWVALSADVVPGNGLYLISKGNDLFGVDYFFLAQRRP